MTRINGILQLSQYHQNDEATAMYGETCMRNYDYREKWKKLLTPEIISLLTAIHEYKGEQRLIADRYADVLTDLVDIARIQSTESSNKIEGIYTSDDRLKKIFLDKTMPRNRNEQEIAGYRDVLNTIHENYDFIPVRATLLLQLHRDLYKFQGTGTGGVFKSVDNTIEEVDENGNVSARFQPVPAWETPEAVDQLCAAYNQVLKEPDVDPLLIMPMFILDFLCIHPFRDGNGRMSRLLTLLLLYQAGYYVGKYISIEKLIERTKESYYEELQASSMGWHEEENDYAPFVKYLLGVVVASYREFFERTKLITSVKMSQPERIAEEIRNHIGTITKAELVEQVPDVSQTTVQRTLTELTKQGRIIKLGGGRYIKYRWNWDQEDEHQ